MTRSVRVKEGGREEREDHSEWNEKDIKEGFCGSWDKDVRERATRAGRARRENREHLTCG